MSTPKSVLELAEKSGAKMVDMKFVDTFGTWQHFSYLRAEFIAGIFEPDLGLDRWNIRANFFRTAMREKFFDKKRQFLDTLFSPKYPEKARFYWPKHAVNNS